MPPTLLTSRPFRHMIDLWLVSAVFVTLKGVSWTTDRAAGWVILGIFSFLVMVWRLGRRQPIRRFLETLLDDPRSKSAELKLVAVGDNVGPGVAGGADGFNAVDHLSSSPPHPGPLPRRGEGESTPNHQIPNTKHQNPKTPRHSAILYWLAGFALAVATFAFLESRQPNFFVQDDNLAQFLPVVLQGCRGFFNDHVLPTWNPHQFLGSPTTSLGTYALTYPPTYFSYAIARWVIHNEYATFDVFCIFHLLAGYAALFWACRKVGVRTSLAATASYCYAVSGFFLIAGRSWYYMTPTALWAPLLVGLLEQFRRGQVGWKWMLAVGFSLGAMFHAGNAQMWCYAVLFFVIYVLVLTLARAVKWSQIIPAGAAVLLAIALAMPLLVVQYKETAGLQRKPGDTTLLPYLASFFLPHPLAKAGYPGMVETPNSQFMGQMYFAGGVISLVAALGMLSLIAHRWNRRLWIDNIWLVLAWVALLFSLGRVGGLWYFLSLAPPFNGFQHAFKFIPFVTLFMLVGGAVLIERALHRVRHKRIWEFGLCGLCVLLVVYNAELPKPSFCDYTFQPYPDLPREVQRLAGGELPQRMYAVGPRRDLACEYGLSMMHQMPSVYSWYALEGYDPLVRRSPRFGAVIDHLFSPAVASGMQIELGRSELGLEEFTDATPKQTQVFDALRRNGTEEQGFWGSSFHIDLAQALSALEAYGVRWVVVYVGPEKPQTVEGERGEFFWKVDPVAGQIGEAVKEHAHLVVRRPEICIYELAHPALLAFASADPKTALPVKFDAAGMTIDTTGLPAGEVVANVLAAPNLKTKLDGQSLASTTDPWGRLVFQVPASSHSLRVAYRPPWLTGVALGAVFAAVAVAAMRWRQRFELIGERLWRSVPLPKLLHRRAA